MLPRIVLFFNLTMIVNLLIAQPPADIEIYFSEIHYDNVGADQNEFIDVTVCGYSLPSDILQYSVVLYNGFDGLMYNTKTLADFSSTSVGQTTTVFTYNYSANGQVIQNGIDGLALVDASGNVVTLSGNNMFLSYEGTFTALDGPASGLVSTDIIASENGATPVGSSLGVCNLNGDQWYTFSDDNPGLFNDNVCINIGQFLERCGGFVYIAGSVKDQFGNPLVGEIVTYDNSGGYPTNLVTDATGMFYERLVRTVQAGKYIEHLPSANYSTLSDDDDSPDDNGIDNDGIADNIIHFESQLFEIDADNNFVKQDNTVPVDLVEFYATKQESAIKLHWSTATEINNDFFEIQKSRNGKEFYPLHRELGQGNSDRLIEYEYMDTKVFAGDNYYRLRQVDLNGTQSFSDAISVSYREIESALVLYPNPASDYILINGIESIETEAISLVISSLHGSEVLRQSLNSQFTIDLPNTMSAGLYLVSLIDEENNLLYKSKLNVIR